MQESVKQQFIILFLLYYMYKEQSHYNILEYTPFMSINLSELYLSTSKFLANNFTGGSPGGRFLFIRFKKSSVSVDTFPLLVS